MNSKDRAELTARLAHFDNHERQKLTKRASALRDQLQRHARPKPRNSNAYEDEGSQRQRSGPTIEDVMLRLLREDDRMSCSSSDPQISAGCLSSRDEILLSHEQGDGQVVSLVKGRAIVLTSEGEITAELAREILQHQDREIAVGDHVVLSRDRVERVLPRRTQLSRPDPDTGGERVIVANVDRIVVVVSVTAPSLHPRLIDRYLLACARGAIAPIIVVNKWDLLESGPPGQNELLDPYRRLGIPVLPVSAQRGLGIAELSKEIAAKLVAFVGHSGVGKSSLVNALSPELRLETGSVAPGRGTGRHTTRGSRIYDLGGARVIDTPGIRSFGLWALSAEELSWHFPEFSGRVCQFRDCKHVLEPGCAVRAAVESGEISADRFDTYQRLRSSLVAGEG